MALPNVAVQISDASLQSRSQTSLQDDQKHLPAASAKSICQKHLPVRQAMPRQVHLHNFCEGAKQRQHVTGRERYHSGVAGWQQQPEVAFHFSEGLMSLG